MRQIALHVHLALLALGRCWQRDDTKNTRADAFRDRFDRSALAGPVAALEHDADSQAFADHPLLQLDQFDVQTGKRFLVGLALELSAIFCDARRSRTGPAALSNCVQFHASSPFRKRVDVGWRQEATARTSSPPPAS